MANKKHLKILKKGVDYWNRWRADNPRIRPDLSRGNFESQHLEKINLSRANLREANFHQTFLMEADLTNAAASRTLFNDAHLGKANLTGANAEDAIFTQAFCRQVNFKNAKLKGALFFATYVKMARLNDLDLREARFRYANLEMANLSNSNLTSADLGFANLNRANATKANLTNATLNGAQLVRTKVQDAVFRGASIYGISAWDLEGEPRNQKDLQISYEPRITVDNIEVAQFIYLMLNNQKIREVIDTIGNKGILILGRFTEGRIEVLNAMREELRKLSFVPFVFDFEKPATKTFTETVRILAGMSRFVIVDLTAPRSTPLELQATVPEFTIPFVPIIQKHEKPFSMFDDLLKSSHKVLDPLEYVGLRDLMKVFKKAVVDPALVRSRQLQKKRDQPSKTRSTADYR